MPNFIKKIVGKITHYNTPNYQVSENKGKTIIFARFNALTKKQRSYLYKISTDSKFQWFGHTGFIYFYI